MGGRIGEDVRQPGSGKNKDVTDAVEKILAAQLRGDILTVRNQIKVIDSAHSKNKSYLSGSQVHRLIKKVCSHLSLPVKDAQSSPSDRLGDVCVTLNDSSKIWIELKSQTKKLRFGDITQADYVREGTDFARKYAVENPNFDRLIVGDLRVELKLTAGASSLRNWKLSDLWVADLALLVDSQKRKRAGVISAPDLSEFLKRKYLLHICAEGARLVRLDELEPIRSVLAGSQLLVNLKTTNASVAALQVSVDGEPINGRTVFTYHFGYPNAPGRHKLHDLALASSSGLVVFD